MTVPFNETMIRAQCAPIQLPGIQLEFHQQRRHLLAEQLPNNSLVLLRSGEEQIRNNDVEHPFRAQSDFVYLTGFEEPDSVLLLFKTEKQVQTHILVRPSDPLMETWNGRRLGVDAAAETLQVDQASSIEELSEVVQSYAVEAEHIYFSFYELEFWSALTQEVVEHCHAHARKGARVPAHLSNLDLIVHEMRLFKTDYELTQMRHAAQISVKGHLAAMANASAGLNEMQVQAALEAEFKAQGSPRVAFNSIVAGGDNACILHYTENNHVLNQTDLVLVDAGAEWNGYAGDITTTFPVSGRFSPEQTALYELVLQAQKAAIAKVKVGVTYDQIHQTTIQVLTAGLIELGILQGDLQHNIDQECYKDYFMHGTGHWLGRDVHDVGAYKVAGEWRPLQAGMVLTIEPGLYIPKGCAAANQWQGIGIRIEDDVLVTESGGEILTLGLPRTVADIEAWMAKNSSK